MAVSGTDIVNVALGRIHVDRVSSYTSDTSETAVKVRDHYDHVRRDVLASHNWNFALKRAVLAPLSASPVSGKEFGFELPGDFIRLVSVHSDDRDYSRSPRYRLEIMDVSGSEKKVILSDHNPLYIRYVYDLENANVMSAGFRDCFAWALARDLSAAIPGKVTLFDALDRKYEKRLRRVSASDAIQDFPEDRPQGTWADSRNSGNDLEWNAW